jgi:RNA polymerase sigma-70 factor, ECF subfamily
MTAGQAPGYDEPQSAYDYAEPQPFSGYGESASFPGYAESQSVAGYAESQSVPPSPDCPCGHGDAMVEIAREREPLERAAYGDARAFGQLYDAHVDDVYRYLLAWTCEQASARELTERVFDGAITWLPNIVQEEADLAAWLVTMARDALIEYRESGYLNGLLDGQAPDVFLATTRLDDAQRDVVVLRLLLGHSAAHTAHLAGYSEQVVTDLQYAACAALWQTLSGTPVEPAPGGDERWRTAWFEHYLDGAEPDPGTDPGLSDLLAVADALRQSAPRMVPLPDDAFMTRLRARLLGGMGGEPESRRQRQAAGGFAAAFASVRELVGRHPWVSTTIAAGAIGVVFGIQGAGAPHSNCGDRPCLVSTTTASAAPEGGVGSPSVSTAAPTTVFPTTSQPPSTTALPTTTRQPATTSPATQLPTTTAPPPKTTAEPTTTKRTGRPTTTTTPSTTEPPQTTN